MNLPSNQWVKTTQSRGEHLRTIDSCHLDIQSRWTPATDPADWGDDEQPFQQIVVGFSPSGSLCFQCFRSPHFPLETNRKKIEESSFQFRAKPRGRRTLRWLRHSNAGKASGPSRSIPVCSRWLKAVRWSISSLPEKVLELGFETRRDWSGSSNVRTRKSILEISHLPIVVVDVKLGFLKVYFWVERFEGLGSLRETLIVWSGD